MDYADIVRQCKRNGSLFEDPDFPAVNASLFFSRAPPRPFVWLRPKEIVKDPKFVSDAGSRFDVNQGMLGDAWLLAGMSSLAVYPNLFNRVVPADGQNFGKDYCGAFKFQIWHEGEFKEVVVDDRLPTNNGKPVFVHSESSNEFWSCLLEKACAKLVGSFEALKGGRISEALVDFTGGVAETFRLGQSTPHNMEKILLRAYDRQSLMGCSIEAAPNEVKAKMSNGLVKGHAYSVTKVAKMPFRSRSGEDELLMIRVRNPWGNEREWNGAWSDGSREWSRVSADEKEKMGLTYEDDGEFWMSYSDWSQAFTNLELCNLGPDSNTGLTTHSWHRFQENGEWVRSVSAGGCRNFIDTFDTNPQYRVDLKDTDDDGDLCTLVVAVMQLGRRKMKKLGGQSLTIGYAIYKVEDENDTTPLSKEYFMHCQSTARCPQFLNSREVCGRHQLPPGTYAVIPTTFQPGEESKFLIRIFSEKPAATRLLDQETQYKREAVARRASSDESKYEKKFFAMFEKIAGRDGEIDAWELQQLLSTALKKYSVQCEIGVDGCKSIVLLYDTDGTGKMDFSGFKKFWLDMTDWRRTFDSYDKDRTGSLDMIEARGAIAKHGYRLSTSTLTRLKLRYANKKGQISIFDFFLCICRLRIYIENYMSMGQGGNSNDLDSFLQKMIIG